MHRLRATADVLPIRQTLGLRMRPRGAIQGEYLPALAWHLGYKLRLQLLAILVTCFYGRIRTGPLVAKGGRQRQLRKRAHRTAKQQGIDQLELCISSAEQP